MTSHAAAWASGGAAGALLGTAILPGIGSVLGAVAGSIGGVLANGTRMMFYRVEGPSGVHRHEGEDLYFAYLADDNKPQPHPHFPHVPNPHWHPELADAFFKIALKVSGA